MASEQSYGEQLTSIIDRVIALHADPTQDVGFNGQSELRARVGGFAVSRGTMGNGEISFEVNPLRHEIHLGKNHLGVIEINPHRIYRRKEHQVGRAEFAVARQMGGVATTRWLDDSEAETAIEWLRAPLISRPIDDILDMLDGEELERIERTRQTVEGMDRELVGTKKRQEFLRSRALKKRPPSNIGPGHINLRRHK